MILKSSKCNIQNQNQESFFNTVEPLFNERVGSKKRLFVKKNTLNRINMVGKI